MKKKVEEERTFCDICGVEPARLKCHVCQKDLCPKHDLGISIHLERLEGSFGDPYKFNAELCPEHALPLLPILEAYAQYPGSWESAGHNAEFNAARLAEVLAFLRKAEGGNDESNSIR